MDDMKYIRYVAPEKCAPYYLVVLKHSSKPSTYKSFSTAPEGKLAARHRAQELRDAHYAPLRAHIERQSLLPHALPAQTRDNVRQLHALATNTTDMRLSTLAALGLLCARQWTATELAEALSLHPATTARLIAKLRKSGLATCLGVCTQHEATRKPMLYAASTAAHDLMHTLVTSLATPPATTATNGPSRYIALHDTIKRLAPEIGLQALCVLIGISYGVRTSQGLTAWFESYPQRIYGRLNTCIKNGLITEAARYEVATYDVTPNGQALLDALHLFACNRDT